jgi:hypothetical protein
MFWFIRVVVVVWQLDSQLPMQSVTYHHYSCEFETHSGDTTLFDKVWQGLTADRWFTQGTLVSSINKTDRNDITEIFLNVALNTINQTNQAIFISY